MTDIIMNHKLLVMIAAIAIGILFFLVIAVKQNGKEIAEGYLGYYFLSFFLTYILLIDIGITLSAIFTTTSEGKNIALVMIYGFTIYAFIFFLFATRFMSSYPGSRKLNLINLPIAPIFTFLFPYLIMFHLGKDELTNFPSNVFELILDDSIMISIFTIPWWLFFLISPKVRRQWKEIDDAAKLNID